MRTKLLHKLRNEANEYYEVVECMHDKFRPTGVMFYGKPLNWYTPHDFFGLTVLASVKSVLCVVNPLNVTNNWWVDQIKQMKRDYILGRVEKMRSTMYSNTAADEIRRILNRKSKI